MGDQQASLVAATVTWLMKGRLELEHFVLFQSIMISKPQMFKNLKESMSVGKNNSDNTYSSFWCISDGLGKVGRILFAWYQG